jgi:membrane-associated phospholipid phosphatase
MKPFLLRHGPFLLPFLLLWVGLGVLQLAYSQTDLVVGINSRWSPALDSLLGRATWLGDRLFVSAVVLVLLLFSYRSTLLVLLSYLLSGSVVQLTKMYVFNEVRRPWSILLEAAPWLHRVEGARLYENSSFPSGHTTAAFAVFCMLALLSPHRWVKALCLLPAVVVGYSRLYLLQHFPIDVQIGSLLGVLTSVALFVYFQNRWERHPRDWHRRGLLF